MAVSVFEEALEKVRQLAATFAANEARYMSPECQEAEARRDFIDKFFIALGWDVNHDQQTNPYEQEVKVERAVSAAGQRRADYAFHLEANYRDARFYVEAKKPRGEIATADNYFQTIRYAWNSGTPLAALTDFEQFRFYDASIQPDERRSDEGVLFPPLKYTDYVKNPEKLWDFSRASKIAVRGIECGSRLRWILPGGCSR